jgi:hypothetical protein
MEEEEESSLLPTLRKLVEVAVHREHHEVTWEVTTVVVLLVVLVRTKTETNLRTKSGSRLAENNSTFLVKTISGEDSN